MGNLGYKFEDYVADLYKQTGSWKVEKNVIMKKKGMIFQIDFVYGIVFKNYVECKFREEGSNIPLESVAKFVGVLQLLHIPTDKGVVVTNQYFTKRASEYARLHRIKTCDRKALVRLDKRLRKDPSQLEELIRA